MALNDEELYSKAEKWLQWDKNSATRREIEDLLAKKDERSLRACLLGQLSFGTAGIRAKMGAGFTRMNELTVLQISQAMALYLRRVLKEEGKAASENRGIVIGFDARYNSSRFAELAANVFVQNDLKVYIFSKVVPTPVVSFATAHLKCDAGLIITASHNPKNDNGYKAYWSNGAQIIAPHDVEICRLMGENPEVSESYWDVSKLHTNPLLASADGCLEAYFESESRMCYRREANAQSPLKFTYSAFHGVGSYFADEMFQRYGIKADRVFHVPEQDEPDPSFPTVPYPNPEEGARVLQLCIARADQTESQVILANDPDADRIQLAERQSDGNWRIFTGNEMGAIITWWIWTNWRSANPHVDPLNVYVLNSAVSSQIARSMADVEGFRNEVTLTGFKWMGNKADELRKQGKTVILAWEESIGYMPGSTLDKDGISSAAVFAEIACDLNTRGLRLADKLLEIYESYGFHLVRSSYWIVPSADTTKRIFGDLRASYPRELGGQRVKYVRDLNTGYDNSQPNNMAVLPLSSSSEMVTFTLASGSTVTLRASGTEPKIKYYIELITDKGKRQEELKDIKSELHVFEKRIVEDLLQPSHYALIPREEVA